MSSKVYRTTMMYVTRHNDVGCTVFCISYVNWNLDAKNACIFHMIAEGQNLQFVLVYLWRYVMMSSEHGTKSLIFVHLRIKTIMKHITHHFISRMMEDYLNGTKVIMNAQSSMWHWHFEFCHLLLQYYKATNRNTAWARQVPEQILVIQNNYSFADGNSLRHSKE